MSCAPGPSWTWCWARTPAPARMPATPPPPMPLAKTAPRHTSPPVPVRPAARRAGSPAGLGPVDPWLARDLAAAAARNPKTTWCVTVTDQHGHAVGHGCARPEPKGSKNRTGPGPPPGRAGFSFTPASRDGPPGGFGTWRLRVPGGGPDLIVAIDSLATQDCEHRYEARGQGMINSNVRFSVREQAGTLPVRSSALAGQVPGELDTLHLRASA